MATRAYTLLRAQRWTTELAGQVGSAAKQYMHIQYLEIVTPEVASVCATYAQLFGVTFSEPVADVAASVKTAEAAGSMIALPPMELPGQGTFAIYIQGGIEHGLWQR